MRIFFKKQTPSKPPHHKPAKNKTARTLGLKIVVRSKPAIGVLELLGPENEAVGIMHRVSVARPHLLAFRLLLKGKWLPLDKLYSKSSLKVEQRRRARVKKNWEFLGIFLGEFISI